MNEESKEQTNDVSEHDDVTKDDSEKSGKNVNKSKIHFEVVKDENDSTTKSHDKSVIEGHIRLKIPKDSDVSLNLDVHDSHRNRNQSNHKPDKYLDERSSLKSSGKSININ